MTTTIDAPASTLTSLTCRFDLDRGDIICRWVAGVGVIVDQAPREALISRGLLATLDRDPNNPRIIVLTPDIRYRVDRNRDRHTLVLRRLTP